MNDNTAELALLSLIRATASKNMEEANKAKMELASALEAVLRQGVMSGDIVRGLFQVDSSGGEAKYPLDVMAPGTEHLHRAYTIPSVGEIPRCQVEGNFLMVPVYKIGNSIDWPLDYAKDANWMVVQRCLQILKSGFDKKINDDGMHVIIGAAVDRNILVYDGDANNGQFTKRLISLMKTVFARNSGGNSASVIRRQMTDLMLSLEAQEDIRNWGVDQIDEITRNQIYMASDTSDKLLRIYGVNLHPLYELGEGQEYQKYFTDTLGGSLNGSDTELVIGLNLAKNTNSFIMPVRDDVQMWNDPTLHRKGLDGYYGWGRMGFACCDSRDVLLGSA